MAVKKATTKVNKKPTTKKKKLTKVDEIDKEPKKSNSGRRKNLTENELLDLFLEYIEADGFKQKYQTFNGGEYGIGEVRTRAYVFISINGFCVWLLKKEKQGEKGESGEVVKAINRRTFYDYMRAFPHTKETIDDLIENHILTGGALGDIPQALVQFYLRNKFKDYRENKTTTETEVIEDKKSIEKSVGVRLLEVLNNED